MKEGKGRATRMAVLLPLIIGLGMFLSGLPAQVLSGDTNITPKNACLNGVKLPLAKIGKSDHLSPDCPVIITNGVIKIGVNCEGHLNVYGDSISSGCSGTDAVGLRYVPTNGEATAPGCLCEGWGVADASTDFSGWASIATGGVVNVSGESFVSTASEATSIVTVGGIFRVTHAYKPSPATSRLYEVEVTIENISGLPIGDLRYTRGMDWDISPNTFSEYVTIQGVATTPSVLYASNNGFTIVDPLGGRSDLGFTGDFVDAGPDDHGAHFDFGFGALDPGASKTFKIFYGGAGNEADALEALGAVGAEVYSFGQPDWDGSGDPLTCGPSGGTFGATTGEPHTFIFGFKGVGGVVIVTPPPPTPTPEPTPTGTPTAITLAYFNAKASDDGRVTLTWETATEVNNAGFNLYRSGSEDGSYKKINNTLIPAKGNAVSGASYSFVDTPGKGTFYYKLEDVDETGVSAMHGPEKVKMKSGNNALHRSKKQKHK
ncbi:MAG: hypothetical protein UZ01_00873 [Candidatus Brocadia sinica]|nr:MAG: hypothetical protein UZ01_00873 [Candidatus Brocadia sinica]